MKSRLDPLAPERMDWARAFVDGVHSEPVPYSGFSGSFDPADRFATALYVMCPTYWLIRDLLGFEQTAVLPYEDSSLIEEMYEYCTWFVEEQLSAVFARRVPDAVFLNEQAANKAGPFMSPDMYRRFALPRLSHIVAACRKAGVSHVIVHSSGKIEQLVPMWLDVGADGLIPLDVDAGTDPVALREEFGEGLILIGGISRVVLETDAAHIEQEVMSKAPRLFAGGRYIPSGDAHFPITDRVSFENMKRYVDALRRAWEIAQRA